MSGQDNCRSRAAELQEHADEAPEVCHDDEVTLTYRGSRAWLDREGRHRRIS